MRTLSSLYGEVFENVYPHSLMSAVEREDGRLRYVEALERLRRLKDDWNGHGGSTPYAAAISTAVKFISIFPATKQLPAKIACGTDNSVMLEWQFVNSARKLVATIDPYTVGLVNVSEDGHVHDLGEQSIFEDMTYMPLKLLSELPSKAI